MAQHNKIPYRYWVIIGILLIIITVTNYISITSSTIDYNEDAIIAVNNNYNEIQSKLMDTAHKQIKLEKSINSINKELSKINDEYKSNINELKQDIIDLKLKYNKMPQFVDKSQKEIKSENKKNTKTVKSEQENVHIDDDENENKFAFHIFQIGFHKCGTRKIFHFFKDNGIPSIHNTQYNEYTVSNSESLAKKMSKLYSENQPILTDMDTKYMFYSDFGTSFQIQSNSTNISNIVWYEIISKQYPNSKYILNIRNINNWLKDRYTHYSNALNMFFIDNYKQKYPQYKKKKDIVILTQWKETWYQYICELLQFFKKNKLLKNLLVYDVENDSILKLIKFFNRFNLNLNEVKLHEIQSVKDDSPSITKQLLKWEKITLKYQQLNGQDNASYNEYNRIQQTCNFKT